ncbi:MAG: tRNA (adenosine(37)-N6)-threonylcarbamoyltransferase complex transferase subunit TsaD [Bdellovibrionia bacterium]
MPQTSRTPENQAFRRILAVETSCDDTSVAVVESDGAVLGLGSFNQDQAHKPFGGIVPEVAGRNHTAALLPLIESVLEKSRKTNSADSDTGLTWNDIDGLAVTNRPGLVGSLLVGLVTVKSLALAKGLPFVGVNHLEGHLLAPFLRDPQYQPPTDFTYPFAALAVSGGHTSIYRVNDFGNYDVLGRTVDDAAGEAFDKFAKMIGLGFPGGVKVDQLSKTGSTTAFDFPRAMIHEPNLNMSFSGLKTAAHNVVKKITPKEVQSRLPDLCASYQEAIVDVLIAKLDKMVKQERLSKVVITGGVSANSRLRSKGAEWAKREGLEFVIPPIRYCTDNAAMIGYAGIQRLNRGERADFELGVSPEMSL